ARRGRGRRPRCRRPYPPRPYLDELRAHDALCPRGGGPARRISPLPADWGLAGTWEGPAQGKAPCRAGPAGRPLAPEAGRSHLRGRLDEARLEGLAKINLVWGDLRIEGEQLHRRL